MKLIYLHQYFNTLSMAGSTRSYEMARRLAEKGHEVHIITSLRNNDRLLPTGWNKTIEEGINVHWLNVPYSNMMPYWKRLRAFFMFAYAASLKAAALEGEIILATSTPLTIAIPAVYASKRNRIPMVFEVRDLWPEGPVAIGAFKNPVAIKAARWLEHLSYFSSRQVVALSPGMKEGIISTGYPEERVTVIPNSCDLELFGIGDSEALKLRSSYDWLKDRPLVIYAGTIGLINGIDYLVRLAAEALLLEPEVRFVILGDGREADKIQRLASELKVLNRNLFMMGSIPKAEVPLWLSAADFATSFVINVDILKINSANKFFDALAAGKPIAINHGGWQADLLEEAGAGLVLDVNDIQASARKLMEAVVDKKWLLKAGTAARRIAEERFDRDKLAEQLEDVLIRALEEG